jgi:succinate dehydrogenase / fumarate reductase flavoprotein subunit
VFGRRTGVEIRRFVQTVEMPQGSPEYAEKAAARISDLMHGNGTETCGSIMAQMQEVMMEKASVFRTEAGLSEALENIRKLQHRYRNVRLQDKGSCFNRELLDVFELGHMLDLAEVIAMGALYRRESRGAHFREDFPARNDQQFLVHTMVRYTDDVPQIFEKPVTITRFQPQERKY